jgi:hypothetical protein
MLKYISDSRITGTLVALLLFVTGISTALADQVTLSYVDANLNAQMLMLDCNTSAAELALAASLLGEEGVNLAYDPAGGCGTLAGIAAALATAAPVFGASIAQALAVMSPENTAAIVAAVNAVPGVNTTAVLAAVHFGPVDADAGPQFIGSNSAISLELTEIEPVPSRN